ncbi:MAG: DbpA RNA binding domain-containing protein [Treponema sp.]|nr:DbpA RNA binding domain-containing protein [Treponema sp.]
MAFRRNEELDMNQVAAFLQDAVSKVKSGEDLATLEELKKVFKKNVPLTLRSYVASYLLKNARGAIYHFNSRSNREDYRSRREGSEERRARFEQSRERYNREENAEPRERAPRVHIDPAAAATVFVSIGRNRRVFPRDLVGLFISVAGLDRERIGDIRVLANYSFVQLFAEDAEKAINALNGYDYRGRKLSVSYSKQREDGSEDESFAEAAAAQADAVQVEVEERVPDVENRSAPVVDSFTQTNSDTMEAQAAFAAQQEAQAQMTDEEIFAARAPRSSSSADL